MTAYPRGAGDIEECRVPKAQGVPLPKQMALLYVMLDISGMPEHLNLRRLHAGGICCIYPKKKVIGMCVR